MSVLSHEAWNLTEPEIMKLSGRVDSMTASEIEEDILLCIQSGARDMIIDCSDVTYITGSGLQSLIRLAREMQAVHGKLALCNLQSREVFDFCDAESVLPVFDTLSDARTALAA